MLVEIRYVSGEACHKDSIDSLFFFATRVVSDVEKYTVFSSLSCFSTHVTFFGVDCLGTYFTHAQTCNVTRVQRAPQATASVHTLHMPKPVM